MKLTTRLAAVIAGTVLVTSLFAGGVLVRLERQQLLADEEAEMRLLSRSLQVSVENALRDRQEPDIAELLFRMEHVARQVDVLVFPRGSDVPLHASLGSDATDDLVQAVKHITRQEGEVVRVYDVDDGPPRLLAGVPLRTDHGDRIGTMVVTRPLSELEADMRSTTILLLLSVVAFATTTTVVMLGLLRREVTRPLTEMAAATQVLGDDLDAPMVLSRPRSDELVILRDTLLGLQRQLVSSRDARIAEAERREVLERQLREADKLIVVGQLAAGIAHEIGSPLQVLVGRAQLLGHDPEQDPEVRRQATLIEDHAVRITAIVERLQDVVRRRPPNIRDIDLVEPVRKVMWLLAPEARGRRVDLSWDVPSAPCRVTADADEVQQVVLNLALNAIQATGAGGAVRVTVAPSELGASLSVVDSGRGMGEEARRRLFEPFFTTRADEGGTGLGLAVVKSIADRHRARITVESQPGRGSTVRVDWQGGDT